MPFARGPFTPVSICAGLRKDVPVVTLPSVEDAGTMTVSEYVQHIRDRTGTYTHLLALERVGPSHTTVSLEAQARIEAR